LFQMLCNVYKVSTARDPTFKQYLEKIGLVFFDLKPQGNMFEQIFSAMGMGNMR